MARDGTLRDTLLWVLVGVAIFLVVRPSASLTGAVAAVNHAATTLSTSVESIPTGATPEATRPARCWSKQHVLRRIDAHVALLEKARSAGGPCTGPDSGVVCDEVGFWALAETFGIPRPAETAPTAEAAASLGGMKTPPSPWLTVGKLGWTGNWYLDFIVQGAFFRSPLGEALRNGTFVETGGSNGVHASNTLYVDRFLGWTGLLLEPTVCATCQLPYNRPRATNIRGAVCAQESTFGTSSMGAFCPSPQDWCADTMTPQERDVVPCRPMAAYLEQAGLAHVDFFSLDVEEHFMGVLRSIDWARTTIDVLAVECKAKACYDFLEAQGYAVIPVGGSTYKGDDAFAWREDATGCAA